MEFSFDTDLTSGAVIKVIGNNHCINFLKKVN